MLWCINDCLWIKKNIAIINVKGVDYRCILWDISKNEAINILNNSVLEDKGVLSIDFGANKTRVQVIKEGAFGGTNFRHTYSRANKKCYWKSWKKFNQLEDIDQKFYCSNYYDISVNLSLERH